MKSEIFLIKDNGDLVELSQKDYDSEGLLQEVLAKYPSLIPGDQINELSPRRWILVSREVSIPDSNTSGGRWSIDHLFLDQDGVPTLIEVKRSTDTRIRREVVGQMLDYAANASSYWSVEDIRALYEVQCSNDSLDIEETLESHLHPECTYEDYWEKVRKNLEESKLRLLFVADKIPYELKKIVEFLNEEMNKIEVLAVEIKQYVGEDQKTMVPRVIGQTAKTQEKKSGSSVSKRKTWDREKFLDEISHSLSPDQYLSLKEILEFCENAGKVKWGTGSTFGSFGLVIEAISERTLFTVFTNGELSLNLGWLNQTKKMEEYRDNLHSLIKKEFTLNPDKKYPRIKSKELFTKKDSFISSIEKLLLD